jgi:membrane protease YdiL (CAAX protease family)
VDSRTQPSTGLVLKLYATFAAAALLIGAARGDVDLYRLDGRTAPWKLAVSPLLGIAVGLLAVFLLRLAVHRFDWARRLHNAFRAILGGMGPRDVLVLAAASSLGEELLFRGALQPWIGLVPSALIFGLIHILPGQWMWTFLSVSMGFALAGLFWLTGDLGAPIATHFVINYLNLSYIVRTELPQT